MRLPWYCSVTQKITVYTSWIGTHTHLHISIFSSISMHTHSFQGKHWDDDEQCGEIVLVIRQRHRIAFPVNNAIITCPLASRLCFCLPYTSYCNYLHCQFHSLVSNANLSIWFTPLGPFSWNVTLFTLMRKNWSELKSRCKCSKWICFTCMFQCVTRVQLSTLHNHFWFQFLQLHWVCYRLKGQFLMLPSKNPIQLDIN